MYISLLKKVSVPCLCFKAHLDYSIFAAANNQFNNLQLIEFFYFYCIFTTFVAGHSKINVI